MDTNQQGQQGPQNTPPKTTPIPPVIPPNKIAEERRKAVEAARKKTAEAQAKLDALNAEKVKREEEEEARQQRELDEVERVKWEAAQKADERKTMELPVSASFSELQSEVKFGPYKVQVVKPNKIIVNGLDWTLVGKRGQADGATIEIQNVSWENDQLTLTIIGWKGFFWSRRESTLDRDATLDLLERLSKNGDPYELFAPNEGTGKMEDTGVNLER